MSTGVFDVLMSRSLSGWSVTTHTLVSPLLVFSLKTSPMVKFLSTRASAMSSGVVNGGRPDIVTFSWRVPGRDRDLETLNDQDTTGFTTVTSKKKNKGTKNSMKIINSLKQNLYYKNKRKTAHTKHRFPSATYVRNLSAILRRRTSASNIVGVCKPGAGLLQIKPTTPPPEDHCLVLIARTNDLAAGRQDIIYQHMEEIIQQYSGNSKVLVSPLLSRHALPRDSPVHKKGAAFLDISDLRRHHFTAHGIHLTTAGKAILADLIVKGLNNPPRTFNRTPAETTPRRPPPPPTSAQGHNTYAEAVTQRPAGVHPSNNKNFLWCI
ncbi:hypothetical protein J6590_091004 [Homalodisca vitripennis]|nr:hypothetical protein J6590_091004 [Homalodisca vitripennis]